MVIIDRLLSRKEYKKKNKYVYVVSLPKERVFFE